MERRKTAQEKVKEWFESSTTPPDAWKTWTLREIGADADVAHTSVSLPLAELVMEKHKVIKDVDTFIRAREAWRVKYGKGRRRIPLAKDEIEDIRERRRNGDTLTKITMETKHSYSTVQRYCYGVKVER